MVPVEPVEPVVPGQGDTGKGCFGKDSVKH